MKRKVTLSVVSILIMIILMTISAKVYASTSLNPNLYFGIQEFRDDGMGYAIKNPYDNGSSGNIVGAKIWQIVKYDSSSGGNYKTGNYYCVKAGVGFNDTKQVATYNISYDLKTLNQEKNLVALYSNNVLESLKNDECYYKLLALIDLLYLPSGLNEQEKQSERTKLLEAAQIDEEGYSYMITDNQIEAVQQAAIWYFTNSDQNVYENYDKQSWLFYCTSSMAQNRQYQSLSDYNKQFSSQGSQIGEGKQEQEQAEYLYDYLVNTAQKNADLYKNGTATSNKKITLYTNATESNTQPIIEIEKVQEVPGEYKLVLEKQDSKGNQITNSDVTFTVKKNSGNIETKQFRGTVDLPTQDINAQNYSTVDEYEIKETVAPSGYIGFGGTITVKVTKKKDNNTYKVEKIDYTVKDAKGTDITNNNDNVKVELRDNNGTIYVTVKNHQNNGSYNLFLVKQNQKGQQIDSETKFKVKANSGSVETKTVKGQLKIADNVSITADNVNNDDVYEIEEETPPSGYHKFDGKIKVKVTKKNDNGTFRIDQVLYEVTDSNNQDIKESSKDFVNVRQDESGNIYVEVKNHQNEGKYDVVLEKQDKDGNKLNQKAIFQVNDSSKEVTGELEVAKDVPINADNVSNADKYVIKETVAPDGYVKFEGTITVTVNKENDNGNFKVKDMSYEVTDENGTDIKNSSNDVNVELKDGKIYVRVKNHQTDGAYNVVLVKEDENGVQLDSKATFEVNDVKKEVVGILQVASNVKITEENVSKEDTYIIKELEPPDEYCKFDGIITVTVTKKDDNGTYKVDNVEYTVKDSQGNDITDATKDDVDVYLNSNGNIYVEVKNYQNDGDYDIVLIKQDENGEQLDSKATFEVNGETKEIVGRLQIASDVKINSDNVSQKDIYVIKELVPPDEYCKFDGTITVTVTKKNENGTYKVDNVTYKVEDSEGKDITDSTKNDAKVYLNSEGNIYVEVKNYQFDLKLIKRIVEVNGVQVPERIEDVDITELANGSKTTATYKLNKNPVPVKKGDIVKYTLRVYNEGGIDGYASEITEDVPDGLEFIWSEKTDADLDADTTLSKEEKDAIKYNQSIWDFGNINSQTNRVETITTNYLAKGQGEEKVNEGANLIKAFDSSKEYKNTINDKNPDYKEVSVYMRVISEGSVGTIIRNEAAVTEDTDSKGNPVDDRDSNPDNWVKYEDDEDYDNVILESFDLVLRKFIIAVSSDTTIEDAEYLKEEDGKYTREPSVDTSKLNTTDENGKLITTATYNHTKEPVEVSKNDIVVYMLRVYNEGSIDGYASEIKDHLPPYLEYIDSEFNKQYGWKVSEDGRTVTTTYLDSHLISKATENEEGKIVLSYKEVPIMCKVTDKAQGKITNIADITVSKDADKNDMLDRDSEPGNVVLPDDSDLPQYKDDEKGIYIPGQQDDDDFEKVVVKTFDLALRKFITAVDNNEVTTRIPQVKYDKDNNKLTYQHTKDPVNVVTNDIVTYTIRVYNEGQIDGYASEITDDIPDGLQYIPNNDLNKEYRWVMYDSEGKETQDISKATKIKTDYLSKEQGEARMEDDDEMEENPALLKAFDNTKEISETNPDYADVKVSFKVTEPNGSSRILVNSAQISEDTDKDGNPVDDEDSIPDEWNEGEDDQDKEYVKLNYFDLALRKWVTQAIVIEDGKETVTQTGHKPEDDPEQVVKVELNRKKLNSIQVKFKYSIRITNEGDIAGYAKEITDYIPQGLQFVASDNPDWKDEGNNIISTRKLENTLLQPGESADVEVTLTWIKGTSNLGLKTNIAEISEDYNDKNVPDRDSTPDNKVQGEDDIDDAPVLLSISTGEARIYFVLTLTILTTIAGGLILIRKFVL